MADTLAPPRPTLQEGGTSKSCKKKQQKGGPGTFLCDKGELGFFFVFSWGRQGVVGTISGGGCTPCACHGRLRTRPGAFNDFDKMAVRCNFLILVDHVNCFKSVAVHTS